MGKYLIVKTEESSWSPNISQYFSSNVEKSSKAAAGPCRNTKGKTNNQDKAAVK